MTNTTTFGPDTHVAVLMGGTSSEREISLITGRACADGLRAAGFRVSEVDAADDVIDQLTSLNPDIVFNGLHGPWGEDGQVQGLLETLRIPYTHSGVLSSALAMDKARARMIFTANNIKVADGRTVRREEFANDNVMPTPYVVKPIAEGSSVGVMIVREGDNFAAKALSDPDWHYGDEVLVEQFVPGRELSVAVMDGKSLGVVEIIPAEGFYDFDAKYAAGGSDHIIPAPINDDTYREAERLGEKAHLVLGCRGVTRTDIRFDEAGELTDGTPALYVLETNTQPGMTPTSLVPELAVTKGYDFARLCRWMVEDASCAR